jgi:hypothetical protein
MKTYGVIRGILPLNLNLALDGGQRLTSRRDRFTSRKEPRNPLNRRLYGPENRSGRFWRREKSLVPTGIRTPDCLARSLVAALPQLPVGVWVLLSEIVCTIKMNIFVLPRYLLSKPAFNPLRQSADCFV